MSKNLKQVGLGAGLATTLSLVFGLLMTVPGCSESPLFAHEQGVTEPAAAENEVALMPEVSVTGKAVVPVLPEVRVTATRLPAPEARAPAPGRFTPGTPDRDIAPVFD